MHSVTSLLLLLPLLANFGLHINCSHHETMPQGAGQSFRAIVTYNAAFSHQLHYESIGLQLDSM